MSDSRTVAPQPKPPGPVYGPAQEIPEEELYRPPPRGDSPSLWMDYARWLAAGDRTSPADDWSWLGAGFIDWDAVFPTPPQPAGQVSLTQEEIDRRLVARGINPSTGQPFGFDPTQRGDGTRYADPRPPRAKEKPESNTKQAPGFAPKPKPAVGQGPQWLEFARKLAEVNPLTGQPWDFDFTAGSTFARPRGAKGPGGEAEVEKLDERHVYARGEGLGVAEDDDDPERAATQNLGREWVLPSHRRRWSFDDCLSRRSFSKNEPQLTAEEFEAAHAELKDTVLRHATRLEARKRDYRRPLDWLSRTKGWGDLAYASVEDYEADVLADLQYSRTEALKAKDKLNLPSWEATSDTYLIRGVPIGHTPRIDTWTRSRSDRAALADFDWKRGIAIRREYEAAQIRDVFERYGNVLIAERRAALAELDEVSSQLRETWEKLTGGFVLPDYPGNAQRELLCRLYRELEEISQELSRHWDGQQKIQEREGAKRRVPEDPVTVGDVARGTLLFLPVVGQLVAIGEAIAGETVLGEELDPLERALLGFGGAVGLGLEAKLATGLGKAALGTLGGQARKVATASRRVWTELASAEKDEIVRLISEIELHGRIRGLTADRAALLERVLVRIENDVGTAPLDALLPASGIRYSHDRLAFSGSRLGSGVYPKYRRLVQGRQNAPVDVVRMPDGLLTSVDNKRLMAADLLEVPISVRIHEAMEPIAAKRAREISQYGRLPRPRTWEEAVRVRVGSQGRRFRDTVYGSAQMPRVTKQPPGFLGLSSTPDAFPSNAFPVPAPSK